MSSLFIHAMSGCDFLIQSRIDNNARARVERHSIAGEELHWVQQLMLRKKHVWLRLTKGA